MESDFCDRPPTAEDALRIGYIDHENADTWVTLAESKAWNWQQGCMLQWLGPDYECYVIFNDRRDGRFVSIIIDMENKETVSQGPAVYAVHPNG